MESVKRALGIRDNKVWTFKIFVRFGTETITTLLLEMRSGTKGLTTILWGIVSPSEIQKSPKIFWELLITLLGQQCIVQSYVYAASIERQ